MMSNPVKLKLNLLIALVVGSMIGSGIFNLPQNMAAHAGAAAILIGWLITGTGIFALCLVYQMLAKRQPELNNGVYAYARASAGEFFGLNAAWGYWLSAVIGNVSYLIAIFAALGYFFPDIFGRGNTTVAIIAASLIVWTLHFFILRGVHGAALLNLFITLAKVLPLLAFIAIVFGAFHLEIFKENLWGQHTALTLFQQIKGSMLVTVWVFIGIEGASVYSERAEKRSDIGKATLIGFGLTLFLLMAVSLLSLGVLPQSQLASFDNLSMAQILEQIHQPYGKGLIVFGLLVSVGGALLSWSLLAAECLFVPAKDGLLPKWFAYEGKKGVPKNALWLSSSVMQLILILTKISEGTYLNLIMLSASMILLPYFFTALYALKFIFFIERGNKKRKINHAAIVLFALGYCIWLLYAAGFEYLGYGAMLYLPAVVLYGITCYQRRKYNLDYEETI